MNLPDWFGTVSDDPVCYRYSLKHAFGVLLLTLMMQLVTISQARALQPVDWASAHYQDHPLVGSLWNSEGDRTSWAALSAHLERSALIAIGEVHTNPDHHQLQAAVLRHLTSAGRSPSVVWEMIPTIKQPILQRWQESVRNAGNSSAASLGAQLEWSASGWPPWSDYQPIAEVARASGLSMQAAGLSRDWLRKIAGAGPDGLSDSLRAQYGLDLPLSSQQQNSLLASLREGHCNLLPEQVLPGMQTVQRLRDGAMALKMAQADSPADAVLIAGNEHVRKDRGVPWVLSQWHPVLSAVSIGQLEVDPDLTDPRRLLQNAGLSGAFDYVIFTPRAEIKDHCAELRKRFSRMPNQGKATDR